MSAVQRPVCHLSLAIVDAACHYGKGTALAILTPYIGVYERPNDLTNHSISMSQEAFRKWARQSCGLSVSPIAANLAPSLQSLSRI